jgi:hypothetical protein
MPKSVKVDSTLKGVYFRMPPWMIAGLKQVALKKAIPYQVLVRVWLGDRLAAEFEPKKRARRAR